MLTSDQRIERLFCPYCGGEAWDCTGERDFVCRNECRGGFVSPLRERDLQGTELIRLQLENERLKDAIRRMEAFYEAEGYPPGSWMK